ncbi:MAG: hypothetical protein HXS43_02290 [Theionarchaea archaeon]|nr:hypothetical protein [Theionarchaea archaeon]
MKGFLIALVCFGLCAMSITGQELDITFVGTVESTGPLRVSIDEVLATAAAQVCDTVKVISTGAVPEVVVGDTMHIYGSYDPVKCVVSVESEEHFVYRLPRGAELEQLPQSIQFIGDIVRIYEVRGERFCEISVKEVLVVTYQEQEMCAVVTVKIDPVVGEVEEGLLPADEVKFSGTYDEKSCRGSLGGHEDYLRKNRGTGGAWLLVLGGLLGYLKLRRS